MVHLRHLVNNPKKENVCGICEKLLEICVIRIIFVSVLILLREDGSQYVWAKIIIVFLILAKIFGFDIFVTFLVYVIIHKSPKIEGIELKRLQFWRIRQIHI